MISEQTASHAPTHAFAETGAVIDATRNQSIGWRARLHVVLAQAGAVRIALLAALAAWATLWYFEFERRGPTHQRLGPGLSRESDSFWAQSEWW